MNNKNKQPKNVEEKFRDGILEMKLMEQGKKHKTTWEEFKNEFQDEIGLASAIKEMRLMKEGKIPKRRLDDFLKRMEEKYYKE